MTLSLMVSCADQTVLWVSDSFADHVGAPGGTMSGSSVFDLLEATPSGPWHSLFMGDGSTDQRFDGYPIHRVGGPNAVDEFQLRGVRYVDSSRNAMVTLQPSAPGQRTGDTELLLEAEQRYGELLRGSFDAVIVHDGRSVLFMNAVACRLIGVDPAAVAGMAMSSILEPCGIGREQRVGRVDDSGASRVRLRLRQASGDSVEVDASMALVSFRGRQAVQVVVHDLSLEHRSRWAESLQDLVEENVTDAVISTDKQLRIVGWNRSASELYGWSLADVVGKNIVDVLGPVAVDLETSASGDPADVSIGPHAHRHRDGRELSVEAAQIVLRDTNGAPWGVLEVSRRSPVDESHGGVPPATTWRPPADDADFAAELHTAVINGEIRVVYQPIVELDSLRLHHVEALARWTSATRGAVPPDQFIPLAERCGAIDELGESILERACLDVLLMHAEGIDVDLNVNLSVVQLRDLAVSQRIARILTTTGFPPERLSIEVTEGVLLNDLTLRPLQALHEMGVRLVVDDFGTGYATFQYLTRFPVHALKIDASFVSGLGIDISSTAIVRAVVNMSRELGVEVVAEGVETESQRAALAAMSCRYGQGWLFDRGLSIDEFVARYRTGAPDTSAPAMETTCAPSSGVEASDPGSSRTMLRQRQAIVGAVSNVESYLATLHPPDVFAARNLTMGLLDDGLSAAALVTDVLCPAQHEVGRRWQVGQWTVAQEHAATAITDSVLAAVSLRSVAAPHCAGRVVTGCVEREWHTVPMGMINEGLIEAGYEVVSLGPSSPSTHLAGFVADVDPLAVLLSCTMPLNLPGARRTIRAAHDAGAPVIIGGGALDALGVRARAIGADAYAGNAAAAISVLGRWSTEPPCLGESAEVRLALAALEFPRSELIEQCLAELLRIRPVLDSLNDVQRARTRDEIGSILGCCSAALVTRDATVLDEFTLWLERFQMARDPAAATIELSYEAIATVIGHRFPEAVAMLHDSAALACP